MIWAQILNRLLFSRSQNRLQTRAWVAVVGIGVAMALCLICLSVMVGFEKVYLESILKFNAHLVLIHEEEGIQLSELEPKLQQKSEVQSLTPFIFREGLGLLAEGQTTGVVLKGVDANRIESVYPVKYVPLANDLGKGPAQWLRVQEGTVPVIMGSKLFEKFFPKESNLKTHRFKVLLPKSEAKNLKELVQSFEVVATFESGLYEFDSQFCLLSLEALRSSLSIPIEATGVEVVLNDRMKAQSLARSLESELGYGYQALSWDELNEPLFAALRTEKTLFFIILFLILMIAVFNIFGVLILLILGQQKQISIFYAMGLPLNRLKYIYVAYAMGLGIFGIILGTTLTVGFFWFMTTFNWLQLDPNIYFVSKLPLKLSIKVMVLYSLGTLILCYIVSQLALALKPEQIE